MKHALHTGSSTGLFKVREQGIKVARGAMIVLALLLMSVTVFSQAGSRLYLRFDNDSVRDYEGIRIKHVTIEDNEQYAVLGRNIPYIGAPTNLLPIAFALIPPAASASTAHNHYLESFPNLQGYMGDPSDFWVNVGTGFTITAMKDRLSSPNLLKMSLFDIDNTLAPLTSSSDDYALTASPTINQIIDVPSNSNALLYDAGASTPQYIVAFNCIAAPAGGTANPQSMGVTAIDASNRSNVLWTSVLNQNAPYLHYVVRDMCMVSASGSSQYAVCGQLRNLSNGVNGGLITMMNNNGTVAWQKVYNPTISNVSVVFNGITERADGGTNNHLVVSGTIHSTSNAFPTSIIYVGIDPASGNLLWSRRYTISNGDSVSGYRNIEMSDVNKANAIVGTITHISDGRTSGTLLLVGDPSHEDGSCSELVRWWNYYDTKDHDDNYVNTALFDLSPIIGGHPYELSAVGKAQVTHQYTQRYDLLWLETGFSGTHGRSFSTGLLGRQSHCTDAPVDFDCDSMQLSVTALDPTLFDKFEYYSTPDVNVIEDKYERVCDDSEKADLDDEDLERPGAQESNNSIDFTFQTENQFALHLADVPSILLPLPHEAFYRIEIYTLLGSLLKLTNHACKPIETAIEVPISGLSSGTYIVRIESSRGSMSFVLPIAQ